MTEGRIDVKILGIVGSPRRGNTEILVKEALKSARNWATSRRRLSILLS